MAEQETSCNFAQSEFYEEDVTGKDPEHKIEGNESYEDVFETLEYIPRETRPQIVDDVYFERDGITFTPDYAVGHIQCVLEYPACKIRRGVYTGTWEELAADLDMWMATAARPDYILGKTHFSIYGHNHTAQNLSFNNLKAASVGDRFYLISPSGVYVYSVVNIFADWRPDAAKKYVHDMTLASEKCYIITCGRDNFLINGQSSRYKDFIVEGRLEKKISIQDYLYEVE